MARFHTHSVLDNPGQLMGIAALAAAVGAMTAMLFTPRTGQQVRGGLKRRGMHMKDEMQHRMHHAKQDVDTHLEDGVENLQDMASKAKNQMPKAVDDVTDHIRKHGEH